MSHSTKTMNSPQELLKSCLNQAVLIKIDSGQQIFGVLRSLDFMFNIVITDCQVVSQDSQISKQDKLYINGKFIQSFRLANNAVKQIETKAQQNIVPQQPVMNMTVKNNVFTFSSSKSSKQK